MDSGQGSAQTKQAKNSKKWPRVLLAVVLVASLAGNAFLVFEKLNTKQEKNMTGAVCGDDVIEEYNNLYSSSTTNNEQYTSLLKSIEAKDNYREDINCIYLSYVLKNTIGDYSSEYFKLVQDKINNGFNPSLKIENIYTMKHMDFLEKIGGKWADIGVPGDAEN